jgi:hypothetical protein
LKIKIPLSEILSIEKYITSLVVPNGIQFLMKDQRVRQKINNEQQTNKRTKTTKTSTNTAAKIITNQQINQQTNKRRTCTHKQVHTHKQT